MPPKRQTRQDQSESQGPYPNTRTTKAKQKENKDNQIRGKRRTVLKLEQLQQDLQVLQGNVEDIITYEGSDHKEVIKKIEQAEKKLKALSTKGFEAFASYNEEMNQPLEPGRIRKLMKKLRELARDANLQNFEPVIEEIESGLKTCPRWHSFDMVVETKYYDPDGRGEVNACYYMWKDDTPIFLADATYSWPVRGDVYGEYSCGFTRKDWEALEFVPKDLHKFLPKESISTEMCEGCKSEGDLFEAYQAHDKSEWFLWLIAELADEESDEESTYWNLLKKFVPKRKATILD
ncbi:hypothetical protein BCR41DRAFT_347582 [Lobosporangium transversale]|uniref:Uncharacterized protein n=1 Tax=Lobosporangium transversale TaxID=64571 RepID=A0A1Y2GWE4_9FUNG|nr:hypothetical protein BCR41DRAFT_347582 [Lobosporangium transversale]ORZ26585.1 hypothetical protein BCR41DRAFT_347582 [Lobosporangium transversale]|eukprot:XP_021884348.1 hypothetical protein BCR41DRAFT_347582 [Lobosporangium transversale]